MCHSEMCNQERHTGRSLQYILHSAFICGGCSHKPYESLPYLCVGRGLAPAVGKYDLDGRIFRKWQRWTADTRGRVSLQLSTIPVRRAGLAPAVYFGFLFELFYNPYFFSAKWTEWKNRFCIISLVESDSIFLYNILRASDIPVKARR